MPANEAKKTQITRKMGDILRRKEAKSASQPDIIE